MKNLQRGGKWGKCEISDQKYLSVQRENTCLCEKISNVISCEEMGGR